MMKYLLILSISLSITGVFAQLNVQHYSVTKAEKSVLKYGSSSINKTQNCGVDTLYYTDAKASNQAVKVAFTTGSTTNSFATSYGQKFVGASNVTVHGFRWYGRSNDPLLASNPSINVVCEMYAADGTGLPTGVALASEIVTVDTNSSNLEHNVVFTTPVVTSGDYVIVINNNQSDQLFVLSNDETANDGVDENLSSVYYEPLGSWRKSTDVFGFGDFDMLFLPFVEYDITAAFTTAASGCQNVESTFTNTSSNHFTNRMLNSDVYNGNAVQHDWTYGDGNLSNDLTTGANTYITAGMFNQTLTSTLTGWTMTCTDLAVNSFTVNPQPASPTSASPAAVCEYDTLADLTASGGAMGATYTWYSDSLLATQIGTGTPFVSNIHLADTVFVTITENGCESIGTKVPLDFISNPIPTYTSNDQGAGVFDFTGPSASTFAWDFGDGGVDATQSPSHTFSGPGPFVVCLDVIYANSCTNQYCETFSTTGISDFEQNNLVRVFPVPAADILNVNTEIKDKMNVSVFDIYGKEVLKAQMFGSNTLNVSELSSGVYLIKFTHEGEILSEVKIQKL